MRNLFVKSISFLLLLVVTVNNTMAQVKPKKTVAKKSTVTGANANPFGTGGGTINTTTKPKTTKGGGANANPFGNSGGNEVSTDPFGNSPKTGKPDTAKRPSGSNAPLTFSKSSSGNPLTDYNKVSLRNDNIVEANSIKERTPLTYDFIREDDAVFKQRIWRIIDAREKINLCFKNPIEGDNGSELFFVMLYKAVMEGGITAFEDERFTTPFNKEKFKASFSGGTDTVPVYGDLNNPELITERRVGSKEFPVDSIYRFQLKEEVVFDKEASRLVTRILGIAPMGPLILPSGKILEGPPQVQFWIYYPDIRGILSKYEVYNPKNFGNRMSWEDLFESRMFSSYVTKSTFDNPFDQTLSMKHGKNKLFMLLEGEAIKEKIFNYEQDLWSY